MRVRLPDVTLEQLKTADVIEALDPTQPSSRQQVWGQGVVLPMRPYPTGPHLMQILEIDMEGDQLQEVIRRVEAAKGVLHPDVQALKK
jgi:hypothetical protein